MESIVYNFETTGRKDYRDGQIKPRVVPEFKERRTCYRQKPPTLKFVNTLDPFQTPNILPFDLFGKPKAIIGTNPRDVQARYEKEPDPLLEEVKRSRPRLVMPPAVCVDDIKDPRCRDELLEDVYTSTAQRAMREGASVFPTYNCRAPLPDLPAPPKPITLPPTVPPYVSKEWRMCSVYWDNSQQRSYFEPCREFWLRRKPPQCTVCDQTTERGARTKRLRQRQVRQ